VRSVTSSAVLGALLLSFVGFGCSPSDSSAAPAHPAPKPVTVDQKVLDATKTAGDAMKGVAETAKDAVAAAKDHVPKTLRFSGIPNQNTTELSEKYKPLAAYLSTKLGIPVEYVPSADYNASVDGFKNGDLQLCWFGGFTGVQARAAVKDARAIACGPRDMKFKSYFVANKSLGLTKGADFPMSFKGKKFTFGSAQSTSGRLMPEYFVRKLGGASPKDFFGAEPAFSKSHDQTMELVAAGTFETGVVDYTVYDKRVKEGKVDPNVVQVIWESPEYCDYQFTAHPILDTTYGKGFTDKLQNVLTSIHGDDLKLLAAMDRNEGGLIACKNEDFETLRKTAIEIGLVR